MRKLGWLLVAGMIAGACSSSSSSSSSNGADGGGAGGDGGASGGDGAVTGGGDGGTAPTAACTDACNQAAASHACGATFDVAKCAAACTCAADYFHADLATPYGVCIGSPSSCFDASSGQDGCIAAIAQPYLNDPDATSFRQACLSRRGACVDAGQAFSDDYCGEGVLLNAPTLAAWNACLQQACTAIRSCFDQATAACR